MEWAVFVVFAVAALGGAAGVVMSRKPVHAAMSLVLTLFSVAVFFVMQGAHFLAAVQVIVYAGAIVVLLFAKILQPTGEPAVRGSATQGDVVNVERVARSLFTDFLWPFEITSALLVIAVVGAVVLARRGGTHPVDEQIGADAGSDEGPAAVLEHEQ